jgi:hypothetical protein
MHSLLRRLFNVGDALSQLVQSACAPRPHDTTANESLSGRCHREGWVLERVIDWIFAWDPDHCAQAVRRDRERAKEYLRQTEHLK